VFDLVDVLQGLLRGAARVGVPVFDECEQGVVNLRHWNTKAKADGAAVLLPVAGGPGGDHPGRFQECFSGWQVSQPFIQQSFCEWLGSCQRLGKCGWAFECEQVGWVGAFGKLWVEGVEPLAAEHPIDAFGCDPAGEIGIGGDNWVHSQVCDLGRLLVGQ
jgi:hypothetical protein